ncbi:acetyl-CoA carboxylase biotin carboxyl carrier protein subunit [Streptomyces sp. PTM05]|uniref:Biotin carboxyl carrier protein of acetyl-CoA carboxylase n=1 Tax=Streptantibioticus parmotrematis TaxID=2873249 RepID=A0ABS7QK71_9ACTN|nr:biotin/lipoyl-containing protein [Streptantibioticus parmotrematis]MBY8883583.1 acetyl-CoA carboxylase biotin carboxyl carrier protein subunit [Streptantibioticus parmotrematis]
MKTNSEKWTEPIVRAPLDEHEPRPEHPPRQADVERLCHGVADLARTFDEPPRRIRLRSGTACVEVEWPAAPAAPAPLPTGPTGLASADRQEHAATGRTADDGAGRDTTHYVNAPGVGTFYHASEPGAPAYVSVGDVVRPGQPVGVLEVMKMMSTIEADAAGRVVEVLAKDAQGVEYDQHLIALEPLATTPEE